MRPSLALSIGAASFVLLGPLFVIAPAQMLSSFGWPATPNEALVVARDAGVLMTGLAIIDWLARDAVGASLRGLLWGNIFIWGGSAVVNSWEFVTGMTPSALAGLAAVLVVDIALIIVFALALRNAEAVRT
jgi:hypothetical protein